MSEQTAGAETVSPVVATVVADPSECVAPAPVERPTVLTAPSIALTMLGSADDGAACADGFCAAP